MPRYGELRLLRAGRRSVWRPRGTAEVVWEEAPSSGDVWIRIRGRRRWADETDSEEEKAVRSREASESRPGGADICIHGVVGLVGHIYGMAVRLLYTIWITPQYIMVMQVEHLLSI